MSNIVTWGLGPEGVSGDAVGEILTVEVDIDEIEIDVTVEDLNIQIEVCDGN